MQVCGFFFAHGVHKMKNIICVQGANVVVATDDFYAIGDCATDNIRITPLVVAFMQEAKKYIFAFSGSSGAALCGIDAIINQRTPPKTDEANAYFLVFRPTRELRQPWMTYDSQKQHFTVFGNDQNKLVVVRPNTLPDSGGFSVVEVPVASDDKDAANSYVSEAIPVTTDRNYVTIVSYDAEKDNLEDCCAFNALPRFMRNAK